MILRGFGPAYILMERPFNTLFIDVRVIQDRRSRPTSFISIFRFGGRRKGFRRAEDGQNRYVDCLSLRTYVLALLIFTLSSLDAAFTIILLKNGGFEMNPVMRHLIQSSSESFVIIKSLGVGLMGFFLAIHQNFKISFYGMHILTAIYLAILANHFVCSYLLWGT